MDVRDNFSKFKELRRNYPHFVYDSYHYKFTGNHLEIRFQFLIPGHYAFHPEIKIEWKERSFRPPGVIPAGMLDNLVFHLGMIEMVSYWKATCSPHIILPSPGLSSGQVDFWKKLYFNGLGEFFYMNAIETDPGSLVRFDSQHERESIAQGLELAGPPLVPIGGGKDSAVTLSLLSRGGLSWIPFAINPIKATSEVISIAGRSLDETVVISRKIDPLLLQMNEKGFLNGHTPFSALVAFYSLLGACLTGSRDIILSNEASANEATIPGTNINHQYSKTYEFERDFRNYVKNWISPSFNYFSLLRPLTELQIASHFAASPAFFPVFRSCNVGSKRGAWCGACPKCLFTWIILSPFVKQEKLKEIFGKDLLRDPGLKDTLDELSGKSDIKPFECIGTIEEVNAAMDRLAGTFPGKDIPVLLQHYMETRPGGSIEPDTVDKLLSSWNDHHFVRGHYLDLIKDEATG